jgi:hypothetical protein
MIAITDGPINRDTIMPSVPLQLSNLVDRIAGSGVASIKIAQCS